MERGTVEGTGGNDIINLRYTGDPEGDRVDNNDAIIPGTNPNDDLIYGYGGDDRLVGEAGDDEIYGGTGNDKVEAGTGNDTVYGDDGNDEIYGGRGDDTIVGGAGSDSLYGNDDQDLFLGGDAGDVVDGGSGGVDNDTLDLTGSGVDFITYTSQNREDGIVTFLDGQTMTFREIENVLPCFTPGTLIATARGERPVEELRAGDRVITRDNGIQEVRWVGTKVMSAKSLLGARHLQPVLIRAGALGGGLPERDTLVSPNHRVLMSGDRTELYFEESEVLAAAKHLVGKPGIVSLEALSVTYVHFMFDRHEVVLSNGAWTESFQPGDWSLKGIGAAQRREILELFPELSTEAGLETYPSARRSLKRHEARLLAS